MLLSAEPLCADTLNISGLSFPVDAVTNVDEHSVNVTIKKVTRLVARERVQEYVVKQELSDPDLVRSFPSDQLSRFVELSLNEDRADFAQLGLSALLRHPHAGNDQRIRIIDALRSRPSAIDLFKKLLTTLTPDTVERAVLARLLVEVALKDAAWVRREVPKTLYGNGAEIKHQLALVFGEALKAAQFDRAKSAVTTMADLFGENDADYRTLQLTSARIEEIRGYKERAQSDASVLDQIYPVLELISSDAQVRDMAAPLLTELLHVSAQAALKKNNPGLALTILARMDPSWRTLTTFTLTQQALAMLPATAHEIALDTTIESMLRKMAKTDAQVRAAYEDFSDREIADLSTLGQARNAELRLTHLLGIRPDPNAANDRIRLDIAYLFLEKGLKDEARAQVDHMRTGVPLFDRMLLAGHGLYFRVSTALIVFLLPLCTVLFALYLERLRVKWRAEQVEAEKQGMAQELNEDFRSFLSRSVSETVSPKRAEYLRCLSILGLDASANNDDIKTAYRNAVKEVHPDRPGSEHGKTNERFILVTEAYDRLFQLRRDLKIEDTKS